MKIDKPGLYEIPAVDYHADPCPTPSLSSSLARELIGYSALHAWYSSPRLNPAYEREEKESFDLGTAAHAYLLEGDSGFVIVQADDWRTKLAQTARADARLVGKVPLLARQWDDVQAMAEAVARQLADFDDPPKPLTAGKPEQTLIWKEGELYCRARLDWLHDDRRFIDDLKTTAQSANPEAWTRGPVFSMGYDFQAGFYLRGLKAVTGVDATFRFIVVENFRPFALSVIGLTPAALALADRKVEYALRLWKECAERGQWPGYPQVTCWAEPPPWEEARWMAHEMNAPMLVDDGRDLTEQLMGDPREDRQALC